MNRLGDRSRASFNPTSENMTASNSRGRTSQPVSRKAAKGAATPTYVSKFYVQGDNFYPVNLRIPTTLEMPRSRIQEVLDKYPVGSKAATVQKALSKLGVSFEPWSGLPSPGYSEAYI